MNLKEENEELREILRRVYNYVPIPDQIRIDSVLSEQDGNEVASPAQDEREAFEAARDVAGYDFFGGQYWLRPIPDMDDEPAEDVNREWAMWQRAW
ncbi:hypothetical protein ACPF8X_43325, partial [Streptomyces sp. G35A]